MSFESRKSDNKIRVSSLLITNEAIGSGGIGTYTVNLANSLRLRGWKIYFMVTNSLGEYYQDMNNLVEKIFDISQIPLSIKKVYLAAKIVNDINPDILLLNHCSLLHYALPLVSPRTKPIAILHNDVPLFYEAASILSQRIFRWIIPSRALSEQFQHYVTSKNGQRIRVVQHGINSDFFRPGIKNMCKSTCITFIGNIGENKGADLLPDIFFKINQLVPGLEIRIVGSGNLKEQLSKRFAEKKIQVDFTGYLTRSEVLKVLQNTDVLLLPSRVEGFGIVLVEAMMCGAVPVVSLLRGITDDIIEHEKTGLLIKKNDVEGFADAVVRLLNNPNVLSKMSNMASLIAHERFCEKKMIDRYEEIYLEDDDRENIEPVGKIGWLMEMIKEFLKKDINGKYKIRKILSAHKYLFNSRKVS